jgi:hypothetical protein
MKKIKLNSMEMRAVVCVLKWLSFYFPAHQQVLLLLGLGFLITMSVQKGFVFTARTEKKTTEISMSHQSSMLRTEEAPRS